MSGGAFNYDQYKIGYMVDQIEQLIQHWERDDVNDWGERWRERFSEREIGSFRIACYHLERAQIYAQRVDWLISGDDGADNYHLRLQHDLAELDAKWSRLDVR